MSIKLEIVPLKDEEGTSTSALIIYHASCGQERMILNREIIGDGYTLRCNCGLQLALSQELVSTITYAAIDAQPRLLNLSDSETVSLAIREQQTALFF
jgi:hypothetical protein